MQRQPAKFEHLKSRLSSCACSRYLQCPCEPGGQSGMGSPSPDTGSAGAASAVYVHSKPTIRNSILIARFMGSFSLCGSPGSGNPRWLGIIQAYVKCTCHYTGESPFEIAAKVVFLIHDSLQILQRDKNGQ